jgi:hypothetical protein
MFQMTLRDKDGKIMGEIRRSFGDGVVNHDMFEVDAAYQGTGFANMVNGQALLRYEQMGVSKVALKAHFVGKYAWASSGWNFDDEKKAFDHIEGFLSSRFEGGELEEKKAVVRELVKEPWNLARWDDGKDHEVTFDNMNEGKVSPSSGKYKLGKAILLGMYNWNGSMKIDRGNPGYLHALKKLQVEKRS